MFRFPVGFVVGITVRHVLVSLGLGIWVGEASVYWRLEELFGGVQGLLLIAGTGLFAVI